MLLCKGHLPIKRHAAPHALLGTTLCLLGVGVIGPEHSAPDSGCLCEHDPGLARLVSRFQDETDVVFAVRSGGMDVTKGLFRILNTRGGGGGGEDEEQL